MRSLALAALLAFAGTAFAQAGGDAPATPPNDTQPAATAAPANPRAIPVPDLPVIEKKELPGGLIIEELKIGDGYEVRPGGSVVALYHGTRKTDGKVFDSAFERGEPIAFPLAGVIAGWQQGVPGMKVGGIRRLTIPAALGYGAAGAGTDIPPNTDLVFVIQLVDALQIEDISQGDGEVATFQSVAVTRHVIKDAEGKTVEDVSKTPYVWLPGEFTPVQYGVDGMKVGGKRRIVVPKQMNRAAPNVPTTRPSDVTLTIELELVAVRNLGGMR